MSGQLVRDQNARDRVVRDRSVEEGEKTPEELVVLKEERLEMALEEDQGEETGKLPETSISLYLYPNKRSVLQIFHEYRWYEAAALFDLLPSVQGRWC